MSKKNKDIEVKINETSKNYEGNQVVAHQLTIGKKNIGEVIELTSKNYQVIIPDERPTTVKSFDEGYETLLRHWNLFQQ